ncbi:hypothetical protein [Actinoplanes sp. NPDC026670]|uniref:hypothetical protein n=1 Tax=Actinoplanes sp. NPDC026670 TaxID=3154700 RepID=UPI0033FCB209
MTRFFSRPLAASAAGGAPLPVSPAFSGTGEGAPSSSAPSSSAAGGSAPDWPGEDEPEPRPDWRERFALGTDLALIGIVVTAAALPLLTLTAALAAGSTAVHHRYRNGRLPAFRPLLRQYLRSILPGIPFVLVAALLLIDLMALARGLVPGGTPVLLITGGVAGLLAGVATLALVAVGRDPETPWRAALSWSWSRMSARPWAAIAPALAGVLAFFLALSVPATIPLVIGFHLFAAHVISDRLAPPSSIRGGHHPSA